MWEGREELVKEAVWTDIQWTKRYDDQPTDGRVDELLEITGQKMTSTRSCRQTSNVDLHATRAQWPHKALHSVFPSASVRPVLTIYSQSESRRNVEWIPDNGTHRQIHFTSICVILVYLSVCHTAHIIFRSLIETTYRNFVFYAEVRLLFTLVNGEVILRSKCQRSRSLRKKMQKSFLLHCTITNKYGAVAEKFTQPRLQITRPKWSEFIPLWKRRFQFLANNMFSYLCN